MKKITIVLIAVLALVCIVSCSSNGMGRLQIKFSDAAVSALKAENKAEKAFLHICTETRRTQEPERGLALDLDDIKKGSATVYLPEGKYLVSNVAIFDKNGVEVLSGAVRNNTSEDGCYIEIEAVKKTTCYVNSWQD